jgi:hypothetical protein
MELRNELWIDLAALRDTTWNDCGVLAFSKDYSKKSQKVFDGAWLYGVRVTLRALGYKIINWRDLYETIDGDEYINSSVIITNCPYETYQEQDGGWNEWVSDIVEVVSDSNSQSSEQESSSADSDPE